MHIEYSSHSYRGVGGHPSDMDRSRPYQCNMHSADCARTLFAQIMKFEHITSGTCDQYLSDSHQKPLGLHQKHALCRKMKYRSNICSWIYIAIHHYSSKLHDISLLCKLVPIRSFSIRLVSFPCSIRPL